jgi:hypothetical protein
MCRNHRRLRRSDRTNRIDAISTLTLPCSPPFLAVWGKNDPFFLPAGAEAFKRDMRGGTWILADVLGCPSSQLPDAYSQECVTAMADPQ